MAQRGIAAAFRAVFGQRPPAPAPHAAPPDTLSSPSHYDSDTSYEDIAALPAPAPPPSSPPSNPRMRAAPASLPEAAPAASGPVPPNSLGRAAPRVPLAVRRLGAPPENPGAGIEEAPSSQYSLRPRRRRRPGAPPTPEPTGAETSRVAPAEATQEHKISVRPSQAAVLEGGEAERNERAAPGPRIPAPSAGTTSGIAGRPDLIPVGDLNEADVESLMDLCARAGLPTTGSREELRKRASDELARRQRYNEDTQFVNDARDKGSNAADASGIAAQSGDRNNGKSSIVRKLSVAGARSDARGFDITTTTVNMAPLAFPHSGQICEGDAGAAVGKSSEGIKAMSKVLPAKPEDDGNAEQNAHPPASLNLQIPERSEIWHRNEPPSAFRTVSSSGVGFLRDLPSSPAISFPSSARNFAASGRRPFADRRAPEQHMNPACSVDARGGWQQNADVLSIFREVAAGNRRLSAAEHEACLKVLQENAPVGDGRGALNTEGPQPSGRISFAAPSLPIGAPVEVGTDAGNAAKGAVPVPRAPADGVSGVGASSAMRPPQLPTAPPNGLGMTSSTALHGKISMSGGALVTNPPLPAMHGALAAVRTSAADKRTEVTQRPTHHDAYDSTQSIKTSALPITTPVEAGSYAAPRPSVSRGHEKEGAGRQHSSGIVRNLVHMDCDFAPERNGDKRRVLSAATDMEGIRRPTSRVPESLKPEGDSNRRENFVFDLSLVEKGGDEETKQSPFDGVFAGAKGGPGEHNVSGMNRSLRGSPRPAQNPSCRAAGTLAEFDIPTSGKEAGAAPTNVPSVSDRRLEGDLATPSDVVKTFNQYGRWQESFEPESREVVEPVSRRRDSRRFSEISRQAFEDEKVQSPLPRYLRGFSATGARGARGAPSITSPDGALENTGRVTGLSSFRPRRPLSTSGAGIFVDLRKSSVAQGNKYFQERMRKRGSLNEGSISQPPLSASSLKILSALKRVRDESRLTTPRKRNASPMPIPPSVAKRARTEGEFSAANSFAARRASRHQDAMETTNGGRSPSNHDTPLINRGDHSERMAVPEMPSYALKTPGSASLKRRSIAYGSGRKRPKAVKLSDAAVAEMKSLVEKPSVEDRKAACTQNAAQHSPPQQGATGMRNLESGEAGARTDSRVEQPPPSQNVLGVSNAHRELAEKDRVDDGNVNTKKAFSPSVSTPPSFAESLLFPGSGESKPFATNSGRKLAFPGSFSAGGSAPNFGKGPTIDFSERLGSHSTADPLPRADPAQIGTQKENDDRQVHIANDLSVPAPASVFGLPRNQTAENNRPSAGTLAGGALDGSERDPQGEVKNRSEHQPETRGVVLNQGGPKEVLGSSGFPPFKDSTGEGPLDSRQIAPTAASKASTDLGGASFGSAPLQPDARQSDKSSAPNGFKEEQAPTKAGGTLQATDKPQPNNLSGEPGAVKLSRRSSDVDGISKTQTITPASGKSLFSSSPLVLQDTTEPAVTSRVAFSGTEANNSGPGVEALNSHANTLTPAELGRRDAGSLSALPQDSTPKAVEKPASSNIAASEKPLEHEKSSDIEITKQNKSASENDGFEKAPKDVSVLPVADAHSPQVASAPSPLPLGSEGAAGISKPLNPTSNNSGVFGSLAGTGAASALPFTFGVQQDDDKKSSITLPGAQQFSTSPPPFAPAAAKGSESGADAMTTSASPLSGGFPAFGKDKALPALKPSAQAEVTSGHSFGQPASGASLGSFGGAFGSSTAQSQNQNPFRFSSSAPVAGKETAGPFGGPTFGASFNSAPLAKDFVFGAATPQSANPKELSVEAAATNPFGLGSSKSAAPFGSTPPAFGSGLPFGGGLVAPKAPATPFESSAKPASAMNNLFGTSQPGWAGGAPAFGSSQPSFGATPAFGMSASPSSNAPFGSIAPNAEAGAQPSFGGFGTSSSTGGSLPGPFGSAINPMGSAVPNQAPFGTPFGSSVPTTFGAPGASGPANVLGGGSGFNVGSNQSTQQQQPMRRNRRTLRGKRTFR